jgi:hypothetical protein
MQQHAKRGVKLQCELLRGFSNYVVSATVWHFNNTKNVAVNYYVSYIPSQFGPFLDICMSNRNRLGLEWRFGSPLFTIFIFWLLIYRESVELDSSSFSFKFSRFNFDKISGVTTRSTTLSKPGALGKRLLWGPLANTKFKQSLLKLKRQKSLVDKMINIIHSVAGTIRLPFRLWLHVNRKFLVVYYQLNFYCCH